MINKMKSLLFSGAMILSLPMRALAAGYQDPKPPDGVPTASDLPTLIMNIINWLLSFLGALAVLMIVVAGIMYITSGGDGDRVDKANPLARGSNITPLGAFLFDDTHDIIFTHDDIMGIIE